MNMFKLRYSYGKVGNDKLGERFPYLYTIAKSYKENDKDITFPVGIGVIMVMAILMMVWHILN